MLSKSWTVTQKQHTLAKTHLSCLNRIRGLTEVVVVAAITGPGGVFFPREKVCTSAGRALQVSFPRPVTSLGVQIGATPPCGPPSEGSRLHFSTVIAALLIAP